MRCWTWLAVALLAVAVPGCANKGGGAEPTESDDPGDFAFADETDPNVKVEVNRGGGSSGSGAEVDPNAPTELVVRTVDPAGRLISNVSVDVLGTELYGTTNKTGEILFSPITAGSFVLRLRAEQDWFKILQVNITTYEHATTTVTAPMPYRDGLLSPPHDHDAWLGRTEFELFRLTIDQDCYVSPNVCISPDGDRTTTYRFPTEAAIPIGTARVRVSLKFDSPTNSPAGFLFSPPFEVKIPTGPPGPFLPPPAFPVEFNKSGDVDSFAILPENWDPAHSMQSLWKFSWRQDLWTNVAGQRVSQGIWLGPFEVTVWVERIDGPLPIDPPHPDFWGGATVLRLLEWNYTTQGQPDVDVANGRATGTWYGPANTLVVPGTKELLVTTWANFTGPTANLRLTYQPFGGGDGRSGPPLDERSEVASGTAGKYQWRIPTPPAWWDPVYEEFSRWRFNLQIGEDATTDVGVGIYQAHTVVDMLKQ